MHIHKHIHVCIRAFLVVGTDTIYLTDRNPRYQARPGCWGLARPLLRLRWRRHVRSLPWWVRLSLAAVEQGAKEKRVVASKVSSVWFNSDHEPEWGNCLGFYHSHTYIHTYRMCSYTHLNRHRLFGSSTSRPTTLGARLDVGRASGRIRRLRRLGPRVRPPVAGGPGAGPEVHGKPWGPRAKP